jgi:hypothetical protein
MNIRVTESKQSNRNMTLLGRLLFLLALPMLFNCTAGELSKEELHQYILDESAGLYKSAEMKGTKVEVTYWPTDLLVEQETGNTVSSAIVDSLRKKYNRYYYFTVSLSHNNKEALHQSNDREYRDLVQTMAFRMHKFVKLTTAQRDTIPLADYILDRTYGTTGSTSLLFAFNNEKAQGSDWVQFNLNEFGLHVGNQRFRFETDALNKTPNLKFNQAPNGE